MPFLGPAESVQLRPGSDTLSPVTAGNRSGTSILDVPKRIRLRSCIPTTAWGVSSAAYAPTWNLEMPYLSVYPSLSISHGFDTVLTCLDGLMMQPASPVHMKQAAHAARLTGVP